jgi:AcrR family transcriptional regulator
VHAEDGTALDIAGPHDPEMPDRAEVSTRFVKRIRRGPGSYDRRLSPDQRKDEQRLTLIDAATFVFAEHGYSRASVASILDASGLSRGTFYRHFKDLHEIFLAVQENAGDVLVAKIESANLPEFAPIERLRRSIEAYLTHCAEHGDLSRIFHQEALLNGEAYATLRNRCISQIEGFLRNGLRAALELEQIPAMPSDLTISAVIIAIEGLARQYLAEHREHALQEAYEPLLRLALRAFT